MCPRPYPDSLIFENPTVLIDARSHTTPSKESDVKTGLRIHEATDSRSNPKEVADLEWVAEGLSVTGSSVDILA